jgi:hypothetical protein
MRTTARVILVALVAVLTACERQNATNNDAPASRGASDSPSGRLADLSASLADVRAAFNARKGEARFLTLLSPT